MNLFMAILKEHEARTGHDITKKRNPFCDVCMYLKAEYDALNKAEAEYYNKAHAEAKMLEETTP